MTTLTLDPEFVRAISNMSELLPRIMLADSNIYSMVDAVQSLPQHLIEVLSQLGSTCRILLRENGYVCVQGLPLDDSVRTILMMGIELGELFADLSHQPTIVCEATPSLGAGLQGNQTEQLFLHTDFAMLKTPPSATLIQCRMSDPAGDDYGRNGIAVAQHIVSRYFGSNALNTILNTPLPFAGRTPSGQEIVLSEPILKIQSGELARVRFHPSRIHHGFRMRGTPPTWDEAEVLRQFQDMALNVRSEHLLRVGDILIVNNRTTLHDRTRCSIRLKLDGFESRISHILFVQELKS
jgi:hypothetical protein